MQAFIYRLPPAAASDVLKNLSVSQENISGGGLIDLPFHVKIYLINMLMSPQKLVDILHIYIT